jgi:outer membrane receptor protein involved in Fe transport
LGDARWTAVLAGPILTLARASMADDLGPRPPSPAGAEEVTVRGTHDDADAASESSAGHRELELRPRLRPGDLLESVPGLVVVQPEGGGKANEYFLRGFDADHGTDVALFVDGVPVNLPSHAHGQGYSDLHFVIPELITSVDGYRGPYYAQFGDFATAGAVNLRLAEALDESLAQYAVGPYGIQRGVVIESPRLGDDWHAVAAAELSREDGPFVHPEGFTRYNVYARVAHDFGSSSKLSLTWMSHGGSWSAPGQVPARAVCGEGEAGEPPPRASGAACIDRFDTVDSSQGGSTQRHALSLAYSLRSGDSDLTATVYGSRYDFKLFSNFTFFARDPVNGDEIEQDDDRTTVGGDVRVRSHVHYAGMRLMTTVGIQVRQDVIDSGLSHDKARTELAPWVRAGVDENEVGAYLEEEVRLDRFVRFVLAARADRVGVDVDDRLGSSGGGSRSQTLLSPKYTVAVSPIPGQVDLYANYGRGFHSNDARGAVLPANAVTLMTPATGYEVGASFRPARDLRLTADAFLTDLDSELVWDGDTGTTSAAGRTRRYGVEVGARYRLGGWLFADVDASFVEARFRDAAPGRDAVPLAPSRVITAGVGAKKKFGDVTPMGEVRVRSIGDRPATEDGSLVAQGFTLVDATLGARWKSIELALDAQNVLDASWRQASFATTSRLAWEPRPVTGINYTPGWPRTIIGHVAIYWR